MVWRRTYTPSEVVGVLERLGWQEVRRPESVQAVPSGNRRNSSVSKGQAEGQSARCCYHLSARLQPLHGVAHCL